MEIREWLYLNAVLVYVECFKFLLGAGMEHYKQDEVESVQKAHDAKCKSSFFFIVDAWVDGVIAILLVERVNYVQDEVEGSNQPGERQLAPVHDHAAVQEVDIQHAEGEHMHQPKPGVIEHANGAI